MPMLKCSSTLMALLPPVEPFKLLSMTTSNILKLEHEPETEHFLNMKLSILASNHPLFCLSSLTYRQPCEPENNKTVFISLCTAVVGCLKTEQL